MYSVIMKSHRLHKLVWTSRPLMQAAEACVEAGLKGTGLTVRMRAVLEILHTYGDLSVPEIAAKLEINRQYVQLMVNETLATGVTEQRPNPRHKRSPILMLTDEGRRLIEDIIARELALMEEIGADFDSEEISIAMKVVLALTERLKERAGENG
ncbi:MarR family transcriptional regulator [Aliiroseovarius sp. Z3]|uniref:MarR family winged helix-turn-helix transcriptional regulator n=1 Tax=Aliiroseovarius sp. Z3 TaxID=2811402 RepID=UPI0023B2344A|nr:MarR family transcriptional regulator [Aliiroseovarius sp. Z3]MDE9451696.1 MarR family transcriptional regulator [Aliiroseovarius sp. Z3]